MKNFPLQAALCLALSFLIAFPVPGRGTENVPRFQHGNITLGAKFFSPKPEWGWLNFVIDADGQGHVRDQFNFGDGDILAVYFLNKKEKVGENSFTFSGDAIAASAISQTPDQQKIIGHYQLAMTLLKSGLIEIKSDFKAAKGVKPDNRYLVIELPEYMKVYGTLQRGPDRREFTAGTTEFSAVELKDAQVICFPDSDQKGFTLQVQAGSKLVINGSKIQLYPNEKGEIRFLVDLKSKEAPAQKAELSPNGIDFFGVDRLRLPDYGASRNLVMNPSFESGFRFWGYRAYADGGTPLEAEEVYSIDGKVSHSGGQSLRIANRKSVLPLGTAAVPFIPGEAYTVSFWARASVNEGLSLQVDSRSGKATMEPVQNFPLTAEWTRFSFPFAAKDRFASFYFRAAGNSPAAGTESLWLDDVQIEKGALTDFAAPPLAASLISRARGNFFEFGQELDLRLEVKTAPGQKGSVSIAVEDFYFRTIFQKNYPFVADAGGAGGIDLKDLNNLLTKEQLRGVFALRAVFHQDGQERPFAENFRFSIMNFLENKHKNKNLFNLTYAYAPQAGGPEMKRFVEREKALGFGSYAYDFLGFAKDLDLQIDRERAELMEKNGFEAMGRPVVMLHEGVNGEISEGNGSLKMQNIRDMIDPTEDDLKRLEAICEAKAKSRPWVPLWFFTGESNPGIATLESRPETFAKFLVATNRGIKKGNPNAKVMIEGGPWNMDPEYGTKWVERYINDVRKLDPSVKFDGAACHHYRNVPERPDMDRDLKEFIAMLDKNGHPDWPVYLNEGGNYLPMNIPQDGFSPYVAHSGNSWLIGALSYDIGLAERISAAFSARSWLVALKYSDRVECMNDFNTWNRTIDADFPAWAFDKVPNTLGRLLGNASFLKDVAVAPSTRCYLFQDDKTGAPIAAIWGFKESVDRWKEDPARIQFDFRGQEVTFIDLMENEVTFLVGPDGRTEIPMSPFPLFIKGKPGGADALSAAIAGGMAGENRGVLMEGALEVTAYPDGQGRGVVKIKSHLSQAVKGEEQIILNGRVQKTALDLTGFGEAERQLPLLPDPVFHRVLDFDCAVKFDDTDLAAFSGQYLLLRPSGPGGIDWVSLPPLDLGGGYALKVAVAEGNLYLYVSQKSGAKMTGLAFYIDPFEKKSEWTQPKPARRDVAVFELVESAEGGLAAHCHYVQGTMAGSGGQLLAGTVQPAIVCQSGTAGEASFVEVMIPQGVLSPLQLTDQNAFGLNVSAPGKDGVPCSLAPFAEFQSPQEPGEISMVMTLISGEDKTASAP